MQSALSKISVDAPSESIATRPNPNCYLCGTRGERLYSNIPDRLFGTPGDWNFDRCPASGCGLIWLDPIPTEDDIGKAYATYYTHDDAQPAWSGRLSKLWRVSKSSYLAQRFGCRSEISLPLRLMAAAPIYLVRSLREPIDFPLKYFAERKGRLLEVGCGAGDTLKLAADMGWQAEGIDVDSRAVINARNKGLTVHLGQLADQRFREESFDLVLMNHVIEHVHDPLALLRECRRVLRDQGRLLIFTPNTESWGHQRLAVDWMGLDPPRHLMVFNARTLSRMASDEGFTQMRHSTTTRSTAFLFTISRLLGTTRGSAAFRKFSLPERLYGHAAAYAEVMISRFIPLAGGELLLDARK
jgi:2-polyprenyl-3-methyl-5-hydroxy-6-metoxy-1,4-benzoquinol methylase